MSAKSKGTAREHKVADLLVGDGWVVYRSAGSHGCGDLVALKVRYASLLVQVKATAGGPFEHFRPAERQQLYAEARQAGARAILAWWPPHRKLRCFEGPSWEECEVFG